MDFNDWWESYGQFLGCCEREVALVVWTDSRHYHEHYHKRAVSRRLEIEGWMVLRGWHLKYPRLHTFWAWVVCPSGYGLVNWLKYCFRA